MCNDNKIYENINEVIRDFFPNIFNIDKIEIDPYKEGEIFAQECLKLKDKNE